MNKMNCCTRGLARHRSSVYPCKEALEEVIRLTQLKEKAMSMATATRTPQTVSKNFGSAFAFHILVRFFAVL